MTDVPDELLNCMYLFLHQIEINDYTTTDKQHDLKMVEQMAQESDMQVWMERVDETRSMGIVIENGSIRDTKQAVL